MRSTRNFKRLAYDWAETAPGARRELLDRKLTNACRRRPRGRRETCKTGARPRPVIIRRSSEFSSKIERRSGRSALHVFEIRHARKKHQCLRVVYLTRPKWKETFSWKSLSKSLIQQKNPTQFRAAKKLRAFNLDTHANDANWLFVSRVFPELFSFPYTSWKEVFFRSLASWGIRRLAVYWWGQMMRWLQPCYVEMAGILVKL